MKKNRAGLISVLAVIMGLLLASILLLVTGKNPLDMFSALLLSMTGFDVSAPAKGINMMYPLNWLLNCLPVILTGLSVGFAYRTGMFNIGGEGQFIVGSLAAAIVALFVKLPPIIHPIACVLAGGLAGACWAFLPGFLKAVRNVNEVVICIMMNYIALYFNSWVVRTWLPVDQKTLARTDPFPDSASFTPLNFGTSSKFHMGFIIVIICLILFWFIIEKTSFGFSLRATGFNKEGARYAGMATTRNTILSMMIAGAFTGIAGALVTLGVYGYGRIFTAFDNYGFDGISVALIGTCHTSGILLAGMLIGLLKAAGTTLQLLGISKEIAQLIQACILIFIANKYGIEKILAKIDKKKEEKGKEAVNS